MELCEFLRYPICGQLHWLLGENLLFVGDEDGCHLISLDEKFTNLFLQNDGKFLVLQNENGSIQTFDCDKENILVTFPGVRAFNSSLVQSELTLAAIDLGSKNPTLGALDGIKCQFGGYIITDIRGKLFGCQMEGKIHIWDVQSQNLRHTLTLTDHIDGGQICNEFLFTWQSNSISIWDLENGQRSTTAITGAKICSAKFSPSFGKSKILGSLQRGDTKHGFIFDTTICGFRLFGAESCKSKSFYGVFNRQFVRVNNEAIIAWKI